MQSLPYFLDGGCAVKGRKMSCNIAVWSIASGFVLVHFDGLRSFLIGIQSILLDFRSGGFSFLYISLVHP